MGGRFLKRSIPDAVADDLRAYRSNDLALDAESENAVELEAYFASRSLPFPMRVFDLGMMDYRLVGATLRPVSGRVGTLVAYRGSEGRSLLCRMYEGRVQDLPRPFERRTNGGIVFQIYRDEDLTLVFWREGSVVCVLVGDGDPETVIQLAFAKAVRV